MVDKFFHFNKIQKEESSVEDEKQTDIKSTNEFNILDEIKTENLSPDEQKFIVELFDTINDIVKSGDILKVLNMKLPENTNLSIEQMDKLLIMGINILDKKYPGLI